jgi:hypothetical protein
MDQTTNQRPGTRLSLLDPPIMTFIVYGGVLVVWQLGELGTPLGRLLLIPALLGLLIVPIVTSRSLGHSLMSSLGGGQLLRLTSGPFLIERVDGKLKPGLNTRWPRYPGSAVTAPLPDTDLRRWVRWRETGSFIGMVVYALLVLAVANWLQGQAFIADTPERARIVETVSFGLTVLVITLGVWQLVNRHIPRIWRMSRAGRSADREAAIIAMTSLLMVGQRPSEWPSTWPELATWDEDESIEGLYGYRFAYLYALDSGDLDTAARYFEHLAANAERLPSRMREQIVDLERPFVEAWLRDDAPLAREHLDNLGNRIVDRYRIRRVQAAVALAENETQVAREYALEGLNAATPKLDDGEVRAEAAILQQILQKTGGDIGETVFTSDSTTEHEIPAETTGEVTPRQ